MNLRLMLMFRVLVAVALISSLVFIYVSHHTNTSIPRKVQFPGHVINAVERHYLRYEYGGHVFNELGLAGPVHGDVATCLVHSFSPYIEREAAKRFLDPARDNVYFANSPAITFHDGQLVLVARIWLDRERYGKDNIWPVNHFADNWFYMQRFDMNMEPVTSGAILGIPGPKQSWVGDGPIEPRVITTADGQLFVSFNIAMGFEQKFRMDYTVLIDVKKNLPIIPEIEGGMPMENKSKSGVMVRDKHWMAFIESDNFIHFVHTLDPLRVMRCTFEGQCVFVQRDEQRASQSGSQFEFKEFFSHLRGGTPFELYKWPYYISVSHATMFKSSNGNRYYTAHLIVLCVRPSYRIVHVSNAIKLHRRIYQAAPMVRDFAIKDGFFFPVGLIIETDDSLLIGGHVNDYSSIIVRMKGVKEILNEVIRLDETRQPMSHGPPVGSIQEYIHSTLVNSTQIGFRHWS